jgi:hypothetical protein
LLTYVRFTSFLATVQSIPEIGASSGYIEKLKSWVDKGGGKDNMVIEIESQYGLRGDILLFNSR